LTEPFSFIEDLIDAALKAAAWDWKDDARAVLDLCIGFEDRETVDEGSALALVDLGTFLLSPLGGSGLGLTVNVNEFLSLA
jgi:hypothetical protein